MPKVINAATFGNLFAKHLPHKVLPLPMHLQFQQLRCLKNAPLFLAHGPSGVEVAE